jgi:TRAP-type C4-dicarboxylate transport system substrate-binding protein
LLKANEIYDGLRNGVADIGFVFAGTTPGRFPVMSIADLPFLFPSSTVGSRALMELANAGAFDKEFADAKVLYLNTLELGTFHIRNKPINRLEDLKGVRVRFPTQAMRDLMTAYGAVPVGVPTAQIYEVLEKVTVDGAAVGWDALISLRIGELTRQHVDLPIFTLAFCMCMSKQTFDRLPAQLQKVMTDNSGVQESARVGASYDRAGKAGYDLVAKQGHSIIKPQDEAQWRKAAQPVIEAHLKALEEKGVKAHEYHKFLVDAAAK